MRGGWPAQQLFLVTVKPTDRRSGNTLVSEPGLENVRGKMDRERQGHHPQREMPAVGEEADVQEHTVPGAEEGELVTGDQAQDQRGVQGGTGTTTGVIAAMDALAVIAEEMTPSSSGQAP